jgi:hypothetical protein
MNIVRKLQLIVCACTIACTIYCNAGFADQITYGKVEPKPNAIFEMKGDLELDLRFGEIMVEIKNLPQNSVFQIKTPVAVAGIRGTIIYLKTTDSKHSIGRLYAL